ncbi:antibiotic biosynthesis monooxygenase [Marinomonas sp.]|nr:putative quinol monooxygenase [Marinomonas sp.]MDB4838076.1 antibiotic biosynthesis monooxygenase [Marinomonas sp.]
MLNIVAFITPQSKHYDDCRSKISDILEPTRKEEGCIKFDLFESKEQKSLVLIETFLSQSALDEHYAQPYTMAVFDFYQGRLECDPVIHKLDAFSDKTENR